MSHLGFMPNITYTGGIINQWPAIPTQWYMSNIVTSQTVGAGASTSQTANSAWVFPIVINEPLAFNQLKVPGFLSVTTANSSDHYQMSQGMYLGVYRDIGSSLSLVSSFSNAMTLTYSSAANSTNASATMNMAYGQSNGLSSSTSLSTNNAGATNIWGSLSGSKMYPFIASTTGGFSPGQYYGVFAVTQNSATKNNASLISVGHVSLVTQTLVDFAANIASTTGNYPNVGLVPITQASTAYMPATIAKSDIKTASDNVTWVNRSIYLQMNKT
jgi:hypothetical protein